VPEQLPPPLPPETRTVGQLVAETIRLYQRRFWPSLALGVAPAALAVGGSFLDRPGQATLAIGGGSLLLSATYVRACVLTSTDHPTRDSILRAWVVGALVWLLVPVLILAFVLPAVAWLGLVGLAVPAAVHEGRSVRDSLRRGLQLGRADYVHSVGGLATLVIVVLVTQYLLILLLHAGSDQAIRIALFLANLVLSPILFLGAALLYFDQAARVESRSRPSGRRRDADVPDAVQAQPAGHANAEGEPRPPA
jgi:hypothetical protein